MITLTCVLLCSLAASPEDWPCWLGPDRDGISRETGWQVAGRPLWKAEVGRGYSSFSIADGRLFTVGFDEEARLDVVWCLDAETGAELWARTFPARIMNNEHGGGSLTTPTLDGAHVYVAGREGRLSCFEAETGDVVWEVEQRAAHELTFPTWGFSASPVVLGDELFMNLGVVVCYDKRTGRVKWKSARDYGHAYSTPALLEHAGRPALAVFASEGLAVIDRGQGGELAFQEWRDDYDINSMTPIVVGDKVFISSGYGRGCALVALDAEGARLEWVTRTLRIYMSGPAYVDGHLYGFDDAILKCVDMNGEEVWRKRGLGRGVLSVADGKLLVNSGRGELIVAAASPAGFEELAREKVLEGGVYWTRPVLANGLIYCRNSLGDVVCRDHRPE